jgi:dolichyl-phosphate-mannose-protein mannosyltransferase
VAELKPRPARRSRRVALLWTIGALLLAYSILLATTHGLDLMVGGVRIRSRSWQRPAVLGLVCIAVAAARDRRRAAALIRKAGGRASHGVAVARGGVSARGFALVAVGWAGVAGVAFGTNVVGGADSSGYMNQARLFAGGRILDEPRWLERPPWAADAMTLAPLGFRPAPDRLRLAPTYPPGYPLLMTPAYVVHERAAYLIVPICGAIVVWVTFALGRRLGNPVVGTAAALLVSVSPTFLYQLVQPMSDVPATAAWLLALLLAARGTTVGAVLSGLLAGLAILIRPNLMPLAVLVWAACATGTRSTGRWRRTAAALATTVPSIVTLAVIQSIRYGSPFGSGYGSMADLFGWANVWPNLDRYPRWMFEAHTPLIALFLLAPLWLGRRRPESRTLIVILWVFAVAVVAAYLPYLYFQPSEWMYTRFLLPAIPVMWLLAMMTIADLLRPIRPPIAAMVAIPAFIGLMIFSIAAARERYAFELKDGERKYIYAADYVRRELPPNAVIVGMQHTGSIWFYARRPVVRWDHLEADKLDSVLAWLGGHGYAPYLVLDKDELARMHQRFDGKGRSLDRVIPLTEFGDVTVYALR